MQSKIVKEMERRLVKHFLDIVVMFELRKSSSLSGFDVIGNIYRKFGLLVSSGTIYAHLYAMERKGLIKGSFDKGKRIYKLTEEGDSTINDLMSSKEEIQRFFQALLAN